MDTQLAVKPRKLCFIDSIIPHSYTMYNLWLLLFSQVDLKIVLFIFNCVSYIELWICS